jgi:hypothetical protein
MPRDLLLAQPEEARGVVVEDVALLLLAQERHGFSCSAGCVGHDHLR